MKWILLCMLITSQAFALPACDSSKYFIVVSIIHGNSTSRIPKKEWDKVLDELSLQTNLVSLYKNAKKYKRKTIHFEVEKRCTGGKKGGHIEIRLDSCVYGFSDGLRQLPIIPRLFPKRKQKKQKVFGHFQKHSYEKWLLLRRNARITLIEIPITPEQQQYLQTLYQNYMEKSPYDFALFGKRCASSAYDILMQIGVTKPLKNVNLQIFHPRKLRRVLLDLAQEKSYKIYKQMGTRHKKWDK